MRNPLLSLSPSPLSSLLSPSPLFSLRALLEHSPLPLPSPSPCSRPPSPSADEPISIVAATVRCPRCCRLPEVRYSNPFFFYIDLATEGRKGLQGGPWAVGGGEGAMGGRRLHEAREGWVTAGREEGRREMKGENEKNKIINNK